MRLVISIATVNALQTIAMPPPIRARLSRRSPKRQWGKQRLIFLRIKGISLFLSVSAKHNRPADSRKPSWAREGDRRSLRRARRDGSQDAGQERARPRRGPRRRAAGRLGPARDGARRRRDPALGAHARHRRLRRPARRKGRPAPEGGGGAQALEI